MMTYPISKQNGLTVLELSTRNGENGNYEIGYVPLGELYVPIITRTKNLTNLIITHVRLPYWYHKYISLYQKITISRFTLFTVSLVKRNYTENQPILDYILFPWTTTTHCKIFRTSGYPSAYSKNIQSEFSDSSPQPSTPTQVLNNTSTSKLQSDFGESCR